MSALLAHAKAAEAFADAWRDEAYKNRDDRDHWRLCIMHVDVHERAAQIMRDRITAEVQQDGLNPIKES